MVAKLSRDQAVGCQVAMPLDTGGVTNLHLRADGERDPGLPDSSRMISLHSSTHSSQLNTVGPAISFLTSCWLLPQNEQYKVFFS